LIEEAPELIFYFAFTLQVSQANIIEEAPPVNIQPVDFKRQTGPISILAAPTSTLISHTGFGLKFQGDPVFEVSLYHPSFVKLNLTSRFSPRSLIE